MCRACKERSFLSGVAAGSGWRPEDHKHSLAASLAHMQVLDTYMFHSFLKARLNGRMDAFARMDLDTQSEEDRCLTLSCVHGFLGTEGSCVTALFEHAKGRLGRILNNSPRAFKYAASSVCPCLMGAAFVCLA